MSNCRTCELSGVTIEQARRRNPTYMAALDALPSRCPVPDEPADECWDCRVLRSEGQDPAALIAADAALASTTVDWVSALIRRPRSVTRTSAPTAVAISPPTTRTKCWSSRYLLRGLPGRPAFRRLPQSGSSAGGYAFSQTADRTTIASP